MPGIYRPSPKTPRLGLSPGNSGAFPKWVRGWLLGQQGLSGAGKDFVKSIDPRTKQGAIGLAGMLLPGKPNAENAMAAHIGHSQFRPYHAHEGRNHEGVWQSPDQYMHGGQNMHGADIGYAQPSGFVKREVTDALNDLLMGKHPDNLYGRLMGPPYRKWRNANN